MNRDAIVDNEIKKEDGEPPSIFGNVGALSKLEKACPAFGQSLLDKACEAQKVREEYSYANFEKEQHKTVNLDYKEILLLLHSGNIQAKRKVVGDHATGLALLVYFKREALEELKNIHVVRHGFFEKIRLRLMRSMDDQGKKCPPWVYLLLHQVYSSGEYGVEKDEKKVFELSEMLKNEKEWFKSQRSLGKSDSYNMLGYLYFYGIFGPRNFSKARRYFKQAAKCQTPYFRSLTNYAKLLETGCGGKKKVGRALLYYHQARQFGDSEAVYCLGNHYLQQGEKGAAFNYYLESAYKGYLPAVVAVGYCLEKSIGCVKNVGHALTLYALACGLKFADGSFCLVNLSYQSMLEKIYYGGLTHEGTIARIKCSLKKLKKQDSFLYNVLKNKIAEDSREDLRCRSVSNRKM